MNTSDPGVGQPGLVTPSIEPGQRPPRPPAWPAVLGVICVVLGAGGMLTNLCGSIVYPFMPQLIKMLPHVPGQDKAIVDAQASAMGKYMLYGLASSVAATAVAIMLLSGGIGLLKRRPWSVKTLNVWAILRMAVAIGQTIVGLIINAETKMILAGAAAGPGGASHASSGVQSFAMSIGPVGALIGLAWACALPVFILIWFRRAAISAQIAAWRAVGPSPPP